MWTFTSELKNAAPGLYTNRLIMTVDEVKPFVCDSAGVFQHVASVPDMYLLPEDTGTFYRTNAIDLVFREDYLATEMQNLIEDDLALLYLRYNQVTEVTDEVLFTNGPMENSSSSSSEGFSSSSSTLAGSTSSSSSISNSSPSSFTISQSSSSTTGSSASTMESSASSSSSSSLSSNSSLSSISSESSQSTTSSDSSDSSNPAVSEVVLTISGMLGTWGGLGNGTHSLDGTESIGAEYHYWTYNYGDSNGMKLGVHTTSAVSEVRIDYAGDSRRYSYTAGFNPTPSIADRLFRSATFGGVTFTWSKGADWDRGNM
jgi:hypothetical protein